MSLALLALIAHGGAPHTVREAESFAADVAFTAAALTLAGAFVVSALVILAYIFRPIGRAS